MDRWMIIALFGLFISAGCSDGMRQATYSVTGEVRYNGSPAKGVTVVLRPVDKSKFKWEEIPQAITDDSGRFKIHTYLSDDGAPAGEYKVGIALLQPPADDEGGDQVKRDSSAPRFPPKYADPETSGLKATVQPKSTVLPPFELTD